MASCSKPAKEAEGESTTLRPNWLELPSDVTVNILQRLGIIEIVTSASLVCPLWWNICKDPLMWRIIDMSHLLNSPYDLVKICRFAVNRSCGHLKDINIEYFGTDDLLKYIADHCGSYLQCIRLAKCRGISDKGLIEVAKKFPLLEKLDISFSNFSKDSLEVIGRCCPLLKSLKLSRICEDLECDDDAFAIAKNMSGLRHLNIFGNLLTNVGLLAILKGCPLLESLDLRECFNLTYSRRSLKKRCPAQIKDLRLPYDQLAQSYEDDAYFDMFPKENPEGVVFFQYQIEKYEFYRHFYGRV